MISCLVSVVAITAWPVHAAYSQSAPNAVPQATAGNSTGPTGVSLTSKVDDIRITAISTLPSNNGDTSDAKFCDRFIQKPGSASAKAVRDAGWFVTGQTQVGGYEAVSFVGGLRAGTSGVCQLDDGNVGLFKDGAIQAIAYGKKGVQNAIGMIRADEGVLKIYDGDVLHQPAALLRVTADGAVSIDPLPKSQAVCKGAASVPNIQNLPINKAREMLAKAGWGPTPRATPVREAEDVRAFDLAKRGVPEVDSCSGTGMGFCRFDYQGPAGSLAVITVGDDEWPTVSSSSVTCK